MLKVCVEQVLPQDRQRKRWIGPRQRVSKLPARRHQRTVAAVSRWKYSQAGLGQNSGAVMVVVVHTGGPLHQYTASAVLLLQNAREKKQFWHQSKKHTIKGDDCRTDADRRAADCIGLTVVVKRNIADLPGLEDVARDGIGRASLATRSRQQHDCDCSQNYPHQFLTSAVASPEHAAGSAPPGRSTQRR